jgi:hypothetical protein
METAPRPLELRQSIQSLFWQLSEGVAFKSFIEISNELTLALIRPMQDWSPWIKWKPIWAEMESAAQKISSDRKSGKARMTERMNASVRSADIEKMTVQEIATIAAAQRSSWICSDLDRLLAGQTAETSFKCSWLIEFLISANLSPAEIESLKRAVQFEWAKIPIHAWEILVGAKWEYDDIRGGAASYAPNDEIDRKRAAIALSHADVFITEGDMANLCQRAKTSDFSKTVVLSVRNPEKILMTVESIIGG